MYITTDYNNIDRVWTSVHTFFIISIPFIITHSWNMKMSHHVLFVMWPRLEIQLRFIIINKGWLFAKIETLNSINEKSNQR